MTRRNDGLIEYKEWALCVWYIPIRSCTGRITNFSQKTVKGEKKKIVSYGMMTVLYVGVVRR